MTTNEARELVERLIPRDWFEPSPYGKAVDRLTDKLANRPA